MSVNNKITNIIKKRNRGNVAKMHLLCKALGPEATIQTRQILDNGPEFSALEAMTGVVIAICIEVRFKNIQYCMRLSNKEYRQFNYFFIQTFNEDNTVKDVINHNAKEEVDSIVKAYLEQRRLSVMLKAKQTKAKKINKI